MTACRKCGHQNAEENPFCTACGEKMIKPARQHKTRSASSRKPLILFSLVLLLAAAFTGYKLIEKKYSRDAVAAQFIEALEEKNAAELKALIQPNDSRIAVNDASIGHLLTLLDQNPAFIQEVEQAIAHDDRNAAFFLTESDRKYGIFKQYAVDANPYFLTITAAGSDAVLSIDGTGIGTAKQDEPAEKGPYLAGVYKIAGTNEKLDVQAEKEVLLKGDESAVHVQLDMPVPEEEEEEEPPVQIVKETEVVYVPAPDTDSGYLLPHSGYSYVTESDLRGMSSSTLRFARNEIYARHGYIFKSDDLRNYFSQMSWYVPDASYNGSLSNVEKANVEFIQSYE